MIVYRDLRQTSVTRPPVPARMIAHAADLNALDNATALAHYHQHYNEQQWLDDLSISQSGKSFTDLAYTYDNSGQLTDVSKHVADLSSSEAYRYDENGNRTSANGATYTPPNAGDLNRLQNDGAYAYTYTAFGERATRTMLDGEGQPTLEHTVYTWDNRHRLTDIAVYASPAYLGSATKTIHYTYDVFNQLILTQVTNVGEFGVQTTYTQFVHDRGECVLTNSWTVGDGVLPPPTLTRFLYGPQTDQLLAIEVSGSNANSGTVYWVYADHLGTVRELRTNANERALWRDFDSFGNIIAEERSATFTAAMPIAFTGRWWDADARLYQYRARWYDPHTGEFLSPDPIQDDFNNTYRYVGNGPTNGTDPSGLAEVRINSDRDAEWVYQRGGNWWMDVESWRKFEIIGEKFPGGVLLTPEFGGDVISLDKLNSIANGATHAGIESLNPRERRDLIRKAIQEGVNDQGSMQAAPPTNIFQDAGHWISHIFNDDPCEKGHFFKVGDKEYYSQPSNYGNPVTTGIGNATHRIVLPVANGLASPVVTAKTLAYDAPMAAIETDRLPLFCENPEKWFNNAKAAYRQMDDVQGMDAVVGGVGSSFVGGKIGGYFGDAIHARSVQVESQLLRTRVTQSLPQTVAYSGNPSMYSDFLPSLQSQGRLFPFSNSDFPAKNVIGGYAETTLRRGMLIDRFGQETGRYAAIAGTPYSQRSLIPGTHLQPYSIYEVMKPFEVGGGLTAPWFGEEGFGTEFKLFESVESRVNSRHLRRIPCND